MDGSEGRCHIELWTLKVLESGFTDVRNVLWSPYLSEPCTLVFVSH